MNTIHKAGGSLPPQMKKLEFLSVTPGYTRTKSRAHMPDEVIERLRPIVLAGGGQVDGWDIQMVRGEAGGAARFTLTRDGILVTRSYVAWTEDGAAEFWPVIQQVAKCGFGAAVTERPTHLPWLASITMPCQPSLEALSRISESASLELRLAWTILEIFAGGKPVAHGDDAGPIEPTDCDGVQDIGAGVTALIRGANGGPSAFTLPQDSAALSIGPEGLTMYVQLSGPTAEEVADIRRGTFEIGALSVGGTGILLTRFGAAERRDPAMTPLVFECPYHIGLLPPDQRHLPEREGGLSLALTIIVQDQYGKQHGCRHLGLAIPTAAAIEGIVARQAKEAERPGWTRATHDVEVKRFRDRYPDIGRAADRLFAKSWASETIQ